jgi:hypothetical protein
MKKAFIFFAALVALSFSAHALNFCQVKDRDTGKVLEQVNEARLPNGEKCDSWLARRTQALSVKGCELLADGNVSFDGFEGIPPRGTSIKKGIPSQGQSCNEWREEQANLLAR